jgi:hypothetical protein
MKRKSDENKIAILKYNNNNNNDEKKEKRCTFLIKIYYSIQLECSIYIYI